MAKCPAKKVEETLNKFLWRLCQERRITKPLYNQLHASDCPLPRFYGLAKIHKPEIPLRPVISAVGSALYAASKYLTRILKPMVGKGEYTVANSKEFVEALVDVQVAEDERLVSFDVKSLYTSLPIQRTLDVVEENLRNDDTLICRTPLTAEEVTALLKICLTSTYFSFQNEFFRLTDGVAMGSPVSSVVANLFMESLESRAISTAKRFAPRLWRRYVDDVFSIVLSRNIEVLLAHVNSMDEQIEFTLEREHERSLPFLDVAVRHNSGRLQTSVYRKDTHTDRVLNFQSHHARNAKAAVVHALLNRLDTHFAKDDSEGQDLERQRVFQTLRANGYPDRFVGRIVNQRSQRKKRSGETEVDERWAAIPYVQGMSEAIAMILRPLGVKVAHRASQWKWSVCAGIKDPIPTDRKKGVVYKVPCGDCDAVYVGETLRTLPTRLKEHQRHTRKCELERSAIAEHACTLAHVIDWEKASVMDQEQDWTCRKIKEALHISLVKSATPVMNKDDGRKISKVWLDVL